MMLDSVGSAGGSRGRPDGGTGSAGAGRVGSGVDGSGGDMRVKTPFTGICGSIGTGDSCRWC